MSDGALHHRLRDVRLWAKQRIDPYTRLVLSLARGAVVVDIGCGNHSPSRHRGIRPDLRYYGVDIERYNLDAEDDRAAVQILILPRVGYADALRAALGDSMANLVTMKHVIEHLDQPLSTLASVVRLLKPGGRIFLSFPSEQSLHTPSAQGSLNFHDDLSHVWLPRVGELVETLRAAGLVVESVASAWGHPVLSAIGALEYCAQRLRQLVRGGPLVSSPFLWSLFGFESVIVARVP